MRMPAKESHTRDYWRAAHEVLLDVSGPSGIGPGNV